MSGWRENHLIACAIADEARCVRRQFKAHQVADYLLRQAATYEDAALAAVRRHVQPKTYWATRISCISLWFKSGEHEKAIAMCDELIADGDASQWAIANAQEIRELAVKRGA